MMSPYLWIVFTLIAAAAQTLRNAAQRQLTASIGTAGATQVRFFFGAPFGLLFLIIVWIATGAPLPHPPPVYWLWILLGGLAQTFATALMLMAMSDRSFVVVYAYIKTEPVQVALFGLILLGDKVTWPMALAIVVATAGVVLMSIKPGAMSGGWKPTLLGLASGALFGLSAIGYRGAILSLKDPSFVMAATFTLAVGLLLQSVFLTLYLYVRDRAVLVAIFRAWRPSMFAGFMGALASQFWFIGFALTAAANVRTLALVEVPMAQAVSHRLLAEGTTRRELLGIALIVAGVALLLWAAA